MAAALGDLLFRDSAVWKRLAGNTTATRKFLAQTGTGAVSAAPVLIQPDLADLTGLGTGVSTFLATPTSANLAAAVTDETGTAGKLVFDTGPTISGAVLTGAVSASGASSLIVPVAGGAAPTADGDLRYDSTQDAWSAGGAGGINGHIPRVLSLQADTTDTLTAATINVTETAFAKTFTIPSSYLTALKTLRVTLTFQATASAGPTSIIRIRLGGIGGTIVYQSQASAIPVITNVSFVFDGLLITGTAAPGGSVNVITGAFAQASSGSIGTRNNTAQPVAIATNASQVLTVTQQFSANTAGNSTTLTQLVVEELN